jgi:hypothetical protein
MAFWVSPCERRCTQAFMPIEQVSETTTASHSHEGSGWDDDAISAPE